ncbi:MAG: N-acetylmuramoyl-L-alanine amidase [Spirochaetes bacterium]|jgi:N-acetylmuramoyl-L-alanine amidase|nr:N-acetylmuramoyl-L-alanine amidase [Spirochaetota bacterium]
MVRSRLFEKAALAALAILLLFSCRKMSDTQGKINFKEHGWLSGKRVFLDPGHGGLGKRDPFRMGPGGITEEDVNLEVSLMLADMLKKSGAAVGMSRTGDTDVPLDKRIKLAAEFGPDILVSLHHNGSIRRADGVNYPCVMFWGSRHVNPASHDLAGLVLSEIRRIMDPAGHVISDFSVFGETGTAILRETRYLCPGVLGEPGFYSDERMSAHLRDRQYLITEAEAYFAAISRYFEWGVPSAEAVFSCPVTVNKKMEGRIDEPSPVIAVKIKSGNRKPGISPGTLRGTLDGIPVKFSRIGDDIYRVNYGKRIYPGIHRLRFQFRNLRGQSSMVLSAVFTLDPAAGDYADLVKNGRRLLAGGSSEGLKMLLSAHSMAPTDPTADELICLISRGFRMIGEHAAADYHLKRLQYFFPDSPRSKSLDRGGYGGYRYPVDHYGMPAAIKTDPGVRTGKKPEKKERPEKKPGRRGCCGPCDDPCI